MVEIDIYDKLNYIFRDVFSDQNIFTHAEMTANDVELWDSLTHIDMMLMVESEFNIRIPTKIITGTKNVGELVRYLQSQKV